MGEVPRLADGEDPGKAIADVLAKRATGEPSAPKIESPDAPFPMSDAEFDEIAQGFGGTDWALRRTPEEGRPAFLPDGRNLGVTTEVQQPYADEPNHYRFKLRGRSINANVIGPR